MNNDSDVKSRVLQLLLSSLSDPALRRANVSILSDIVDPQMVAGLAPYLDDPDRSVQDSVLKCLALNQQVAAIPLIARLDAESVPRGGGNAEGTIALSGFTTPEAVPYLNPLLFESSEYLRLNAIDGIRNLASRAYSARQPLDRSSIPYLLLALRDPDRQKITAQSAYIVLHDLIPSLGAPKYDDYFYSNREVETKILFDWWRDELSGKHPEVLKPGEKPRIPRTMPDLKTLKAEDALASLNPLLFEREVATRRDAMAALQTRADRSSVPYLLMALEDPQADIAYSASTTLHRLLKIKQQFNNRAAWQAHREADAAPLYAWWRDELVGNHFDSDYWRMVRKIRKERDERKAQKIGMQPQSATAKPVAAKPNAKTK